MNRREFLGAASAAVLLSRLSLLAADEQKLGTIGLQLYTVRDQMAKDFDGTVARVAAIGYKEAEFAGYFKRTPQQVKHYYVEQDYTGGSPFEAIQISYDNCARCGSRRQ